MIFIRLLKAEILKLKHSQIATLILLAPLLTGAVLVGYSGNPGAGKELEWQGLLQFGIFFHGQLFFPLLTCLTVAYLCRHEHTTNNWKQYLAQPVSRWGVYITKFIVSIWIVFLIQALMVCVVFLAGTLKGFSTPFPYELVIRSFGNGFLATFPLITLQLWISTWWKNFAGAFVINVILTLPAIMAAQSAKFGPWYPWAQPLLAMLPSQARGEWIAVSTETLIFIIGGSSLLFFLVGILSFRKRAY